MKQKIKELNDYFVAKIVAKDYEVVKFETFAVKIKIDDEYIFRMWLSNGVGNLSFYETGFLETFMKLSFTDAEKQIIYDNFQTGYNAEKRAAKVEAFEKLKKELEIN